MPLYRLCLMAMDGSLHEERELHCAHDEAAIDQAGWVDHLHEIRVLEGERLVACFPDEMTVRGPFKPRIGPL